MVAFHEGSVLGILKRGEVEHSMHKVPARLWYIIQARSLRGRQLAIYRTTPAARAAGHACTPELALDQC